MERVEMIPPPLPPGTGDVDTSQWGSGAIWEPDDPTVLYDPRYRFPPDELLPLAFGFGQGCSLGAAASLGELQPGHVLVRTAKEVQREPRPAADEEAAFEAEWDERVHAMIDELLNDDDDSDEAAVAAEEPAPDGGGVGVVNGGGQEAFQGCSSSSGSAAPQPQPEPARPRRKTHRFVTNKKKKGRQ